MEHIKHLVRAFIVLDEIRMNRENVFSDMPQVIPYLATKFINLLLTLREPGAYLLAEIIKRKFVWHIIQLTADNDSVNCDLCSAKSLAVSFERKTLHWF